MRLAVRVANTGCFMSVKASGRAESLADMYELVNLVAAETLRLEATRLKVDLREVHQDFRFTEHFALGEKANSAFAHLQKVASLVAPGTRRGTSEQVARLQGRQLRVFTSDEECDAWLSA
jgi:hypothetical protein